MNMLKHHRMVLAGHRVYLFGGKSTDPHKVFVLDLNEQSWRRITVDEEILSFATQGLTATLLGDSVYVIGGGDAQVSPGEHVHEFDLAVEELRLKATSTGDSPGPGHLNGHSAEYLEHRREFVIFKGGGLHSASNAVFSLDAVTFRWRRLKPKGRPPRVRYAQCSCVLNRSMYIFGGCSYSDMYNDLHVLTYESAGPCWHCPLALGEPPLHRFGATLNAMDGKLLMFGGQVFMGGSKDVFWFDPKINEWIQEMPQRQRRTLNRNYPEPKSFHATVLTPSHRLLVLGGSGGGSSYHELSFE